MRKNRNNNEVHDAICGKFIVGVSHYTDEPLDFTDEPLDFIPRPINVVPACKQTEAPEGPKGNVIPQEPCVAVADQNAMPLHEWLFGRLWWLPAIVIIYLIANRD